MPTSQEILSQSIAHHQAGRLAEAEAGYRRILAISPNEPHVIHLLGVLAHHCGQNPAAVELINRAIALAGPAVPAQFYNNIGEAYRALMMGEEAAGAYQAAIRIDPAMSVAHKNLAIVYAHWGRIADAITECRAAQQLAPDDAGIYNNLGNLMLESGRVEEAIAAHEKAVELGPTQPNLHDNLLRDLNYLPSDDPRASAEMLKAAHARWWTMHGKPVHDATKRTFLNARDPDRKNARDPDRKLRIGYVSADFREHAVAYFITPVLEAHDREAFEVFGYGDVGRPDAYTERIAAAVQLRATLGLNADQLAALIAKDGIDVLIDLAGHTDGNRLTVFARQPAPVQLSYLGYPLSTGLESIAGRISDALVDPPGVAGEVGAWGDRVYRMERCAWCYAAQADERLTIAARPEGQVTFGSFNFLPKINDGCLELWARIVRAVPGSRLALKSRGLEDASVRAAVFKRLSRVGLDENRVQILPRQASAVDHLLQYGQIDIALDPFPYNGTTTTCEAMWMGVPVITLAGELPHARVGVSLLTNAGLADLIAPDPEAYVSIATKLANDSPRRRELRQSLREQMRSSPLMNPTSATRAIERVIRNAWQAWASHSQSA